MRKDAYLRYSTGCDKYVEESKKDPYKGSESYSCTCLYKTSDGQWNKNGKFEHGKHE